MNLFTRWKEKATEYVDVRLGLLKLSFVERTSTLLGTLMISLIYLFIGMAVLTFLGLGLLETFTALLDGSRVGGAFLTAGVFALLLVILFLIRKVIVGAFAGIFIRILTEGDDDDDDVPDSKTHRKVTVEDGE